MSPARLARIGLKSHAAACSRSISEIFHQFDRPHLARINQVSYCTDKIVCRFEVSSRKHPFEHPPLDLDRVELRGVWQEVDQFDLPAGGLDKLVYHLVLVVRGVVQKYYQPAVFLAQLLEKSHERFRVRAFHGLDMDPVLAKCSEQPDCLGGKTGTHLVAALGLAPPVSW